MTLFCENHTKRDRTMQDPAVMHIVLYKLQRYVLCNVFFLFHYVSFCCTLDDVIFFIEKHSSTMCDFHNSGLIFTGQMHCLPQMLKSTFFEIFRTEHLRRGQRSEKKFQTTLILVFEANSAFVPQK